MTRTKSETIFGDCSKYSGQLNPKTAFEARRAGRKLACPPPPFPLPRWWSEERAEPPGTGPGRAFAPARGRRSRRGSPFPPHPPGRFAFVRRSGGFASLHRRLISGVPPGQNTRSHRQSRRLGSRDVPVNPQAHLRGTSAPPGEDVCFPACLAKFGFGYSNSATSAFSSFNSATLASILARLKSLTGTHLTISHSSRRCGSGRRR